MEWESQHPVASARHIVVVISGKCSLPHSPSGDRYCPENNRKHSGHLVFKEQSDPSLRGNLGCPWNHTQNMQQNGFQRDVSASRGRGSLAPFTQSPRLCFVANNAVQFGTFSESFRIPRKSSLPVSGFFFFFPGTCENLRSQENDQQHPS